jgi:predicted metal-dependent phosphoesterase TrpH
VPAAAVRVTTPDGSGRSAVIDLHLHTTASDGRSTPDELVEDLVDAGVTSFAVTDHDTTAGLAAVSAAARRHGLDWLSGIEITAVRDRRDIHLLAYGVNDESQPLLSFLARQRDDRRRRFFEIVDRLDRAGVPVDREALERAAARDPRRALARPMLAEALVHAGHVETMREAFDRFLSEGRPAYVAREGASPEDVIALVTREGGVTSLAHPGKLHRDDLIPEMVAAGLPAIEVHHPDHDAAAVERYAAMAFEMGLLVTGGSDYHGVGSGRSNALGQVTLPLADYTRLTERLAEIRSGA